MVIKNKTAKIKPNVNTKSEGRSVFYFTPKAKVNWQIKQTAKHKSKFWGQTSPWLIKFGIKKK